MPDVTTPARDVFVLTCVFDLRTQPAPLVVLDASGSGGTSVIEAGAPCAQALGTLVSAGFAIVTALPSFDGGAQYTLVR
jgi:hypothetical protein